MSFARSRQTVSLPGRKPAARSASTARLYALGAVVLGAAAGGFRQDLAAQSTSAGVSSVPSIGLVGGLSVAKVVLSGEGASITFDARTGVAAGVSLTRQFSREVSVEVDGLYVQKGFKASSGGESASMKLSYLEVPFFLRYEIGTSETRAFFSGGASLGIKASCHAGVSSGGISLEEPCGPEVKGFDYGAVVGAGISRGRLSASVRYGHGLGDILDDGDSGTSTKNRVFILLAGYRISGGED